jgi:DNA-directed RNA polymerase specialized sigma24 family protein
VRALFRELEPEDIAQQVLAFFLELTASAPVESLNGVLPIMLARSLRKNAFRWAEKEYRIQLQRELEPQGYTKDAEPTANDNFETVSLLNDFLDYAQRIGVISAFERDLLVRLKIDGFFAKEIIHTHTALSEKAVHWRVERILQRLQKVAQGFRIARASFVSTPRRI